MITGVGSVAEATAQTLRTDPGRIYGEAVLGHLPRLLGQIDRNRHSPTYGSCCRNFWHYRIEDISNSQMQEVVLTLALAYALDAPWNPYARSQQLLEWIDAVLLYWTRLQRRTGSFDEVYRGQDSYAATAFTSYCASEATLLLGEELSPQTREAVSGAMARAGHWLASTEEEFACNQVAGAAAALFNAHVLTGEPIFEQAAAGSLARLEARQSEEGWFNEYGGADVGYSSLTLDYLVKCWDRSGSASAREMAVELLRFLTYFVHRDGTAGGVHGSRNTEYVIPHGIELLAPDVPEARSVSNLLLTSLREHPERAVVNRLDDRYLCYLGGFFMQAADAASGRDDHSVDLPFVRPHQRYFPESGLCSVATTAYHLVANLAKGGVFRCDFTNGASFQESGLYVERGDDRVYTTQSLGLPADAQVEGTEVRIEAPLVEIRPITVSPWRVLAFKLYNLAVPAWLRRRALDVLRRRAVGAGTRLGQASRTLGLSPDDVRITDTITLPEGQWTLRAAQSVERAFSFASAGFFHPAELEERTSRSVEWQVRGGTTTIERVLTESGWNEPSLVDHG